MNASVRSYQLIMDNLLVAHGLTGCNTVTKYCGLEKLTMWKPMHNKTFDPNDVGNINKTSEDDLKQAALVTK